MNVDDIWNTIDEQRARTADLLEQLTEDEWSRPSLCEGWTVRDVAAHLTLQQLTVVDLVRMALRHPGGVNTIIRESSRHRARQPTAELIADLRGMIGSRRHNVGILPLETMIDLLVHGQDIAIPLQRDLPMPPDAAAAGATRLWSTRGTGKARVFADLPLDGFRLTATDAEWSSGSGPEVRGPISAILLLLSGRRAGLSRLEGDGAGELRRRLAHA
ncbi:hypothetical protein BO226_10095 [Rhodococcus sp. 2G]|uniref:maleylpyruvate isomerase family mycothiol-dependent enzyme n=1 Tax=Rhodococcus sp. 2G TaxID=1570939 RepID=UPI000903AD80|nr:maleylpyruvate isomerase family mycothiol-dependent enzyme [Rhodococcus sp. 2G]APE09511.1 hypothetical protein BO226_10095 [Rhodococcus sp. 2G]